MVDNTKPKYRTISYISLAIGVFVAGAFGVLALVTLILAFLGFTMF